MNYTKVNFLLRRNSIEKRVFKLFSDNKGDIYISFPYCKPESFYAGLAVMPPNSTKMQFNPAIEGRDCKITVKLSYHSDGQIHIKPEDNIKLNRPLAYKLTELKGTPFSKLKGDHILTIELEGFDHFKDFVPKKKDEIYFGFETPDDAKRFKFVFYAGLTDEQINGDFQHCKIITLNRPFQPSQIKIGIYFTHFKESLDKKVDGNDLALIALAGMQGSVLDIKTEARFLYLLVKKIDNIEEKGQELLNKK